MFETLCELFELLFEFPYYFNEIHAVYKMPNDNTTFYGVFTSNLNGLMGSAMVPELSPDSCVEDTRKLRDRVLNFMRIHPLMDEDICNQAQSPITKKKKPLIHISNNPK